MLDRLVALQSMAADSEEFKTLLHRASGDLLVLAVATRELMGSGSVNWVLVNDALERLSMEEFNV
jgi:hypothetical protein